MTHVRNRKKVNYNALFEIFCGIKQKSDSIYDAEQKVPLYKI